MNPDATHRIVNQQISEWHESRARDRDASILQAEPSGPGVLGAAIARMAAVVGAATAALRRRLAQRFAA